jgi:hypothetical protein
MTSRSEFCSGYEPFLPEVHIIGGISRKVMICPGDIPFVTLVLIESCNLFVPGRLPFQQDISFPDQVTAIENGRIMKHAETFLSAHTDSDAEMPFGRGNAVGHVQRMRIEVLVAPNVADALEGGITGGIPAAHARDLCLDAIRELVNIGRVRQFPRKRIEALKPCLSENPASNGCPGVGNDMLPGSGHGENRVRET